MKRFLFVLLAIAAALLIVPFGVANRHAVPLTLDPMHGLQSAFLLEVPLSGLLFAAFMVGLVLGGFVTWLTQGKWRRTARLRTREAFQWRNEADRLTRERDAGVAGRLAAPGRSS